MAYLGLPNTRRSLFSLIKRCLVAANEQGFDTSKIEISTVDGTFIELHASCGMRKIAINEDELVTKNDLGADELIHFFYCGTSPALSVNRNLESLIHIGQSGEGYEYDHWQSNALYFQLKSPELDWTTEYVDRHLGWFLIALCLDFSFEDAMVLARASLNIPYCVSRETWPLSSNIFPDVKVSARQSSLVENNDSKYNFPLVDKSQLGLYPVVDHVTWVERLLNLGIKTIQLRIKDSNQEDLEVQIIKAIELGIQFNAQVFINDYWQLALKHQAYGIHLGQEDLAIADLKKIEQSGVRLGISTHGYFEILRARNINPSYIALGHIFPTTTKEMPSQPQGIRKLILYQNLIGHSYPTVAIGGIDLSTAPQVWSTGISSLAVVRAITQADDIQLAIDSFYQIMAMKNSSPSKVVDTDFVMTDTI